MSDRKQWVSGACPPPDNHRKFGCTVGSLVPSQLLSLSVSLSSLLSKPSAAFLCSPWVFQNLEFLLRAYTHVWRSMCVQCTYTCVHVFEDQKCPPFLGTGSLLGLELAS